MFKCASRSCRPVLRDAVGVALTCASSAVIAQATTGEVIERNVVLRAGTPEVRAKLQRVSGARALISGDFAFALEDLNGDGHSELFLLSRDPSHCNDTGCDLLVLEQAPGRARTLLSSRVKEPLGLSRERIGGYRALVLTVGAGASARQPVVLAMGTAPTAAPTGPPPAQTVPGSADAAQARAAPAAGTPSVGGIHLGMSETDAVAALKAHVGQYPGAKAAVAKEATSAFGGIGDTGPGSFVFRYVVQPLAWAPSDPKRTVLQDDLEINLSPPPARVVGVQRRMAYANGRGVPAESLVQQMHGRYGSPSASNNGSMWFFDSNGRPVSRAPVGGQIGDRCASSALSMQQFVRNELRFENNGALGDLVPACGQVLHFNLYEIGGVANTVTTRLIDVPAFIEAIRNGRALGEQTQRAGQAKQLEDAKKRAVPKI